MDDLPPRVGEADLDDDAERDAAAPPGMPRWVVVLGIVALVLVVAFVAMHLAGRGFGGHGP